MMPHALDADSLDDLSADSAGVVRMASNVGEKRPDFSGCYAKRAHLTECLDAGGNI